MQIVLNLAATESKAELQAALWRLPDVEETDAGGGDDSSSSIQSLQKLTQLSTQSNADIKR